MKKHVSIILSVLLVLGLIFIPSQKVHAASVSLSASKTSANIGDTIEFTATVPSGYFAQFSIDVSDSSVLSGSVDSQISRGDAAGQPSTYSFSLKAVGEGSCTISLRVDDGSDASGEYAALDGSSITITVNNESSESEKSSNNYLSGITLSAGTLSPAFKYSTTSYTATVPYSVTSLSISADTDDAKATITSVTGNEDLQVGENTVVITVKAENGTKKKYTITVKRLAEGEVDENDPNTPHEDTRDTDSFTFQGKTLQPAEALPEEWGVVADAFEESVVYFGGLSYPCLQFKSGDLMLLYLVEDGAETGIFYVYDHDQDVIYPYVSLSSEKGFIIALMPKVELVPEGYEEITISIEGKGSVTAYRSVKAEDKKSVGLLDWFLPETVYAEEAPEPEFYLLYCMNQNGATGWYQYDAVEGTYQHIMLSENAGTIVGTDSEQLKIDYDNLSNEYKDFKLKAMFASAIALVIFVMLIVCILILSITKHKIRKNKFSDLDDDEDDDEAEVGYWNGEDEGTVDDWDAYEAGEDSLEDFKEEEPIEEDPIEEEPEEDEQEDEFEEEEDFVPSPEDFLEVMDAPSEDAPVDETPVDQTPEEEIPVEETPAPKKEKFNTIDLTNISEQIESHLAKEVEETPKKAGDVLLSPEEEKKHLMKHLSEGEPVQDDDDDFELLDL